MLLTRLGVALLIIVAILLGGVGYDVDQLTESQVDWALKVQDFYSKRN